MVRRVLRTSADRALAAPAVGKDAFLYGGSMVFALVTAVVAVSADYRDWGEMAAIAYGLACVVCLVALVFSRRGQLSSLRVGQLRRLVVVGVLAGAVVAPLISELVWRAEALPGQHAQAEVAVVERAGTASPPAPIRT